MGKKDTLTKEYMGDNHIFADVFNYFLFDGEKVVHADDLHELNSTELTVPYRMDGVMMPVQKDRDILKMASIKHDDSAIYLLLGIENQSEIHYAMPVKNMVYDAIRYSKQVDEIAKAYRKSLQEKTDKDFTLSSAEYLSGFRKEDRITPVITVVVYFGADAWDGPKSLHEMLSVDKKEYLSMIPDYKLNLIAPANMTKDEINKLSTELREVLLYVKYSKDKLHLTELLKNDNGFTHLDKKTVQVINALTNSNIKIEESQGEEKMCIAMDEIRADIQAETRAEMRMEIALSMLKSKLLSYDQISNIIGLPIEVLKKLEISN